MEINTTELNELMKQFYLHERDAYDGVQTEECIKHYEELDEYQVILEGFVKGEVAVKTVVEKFPAFGLRQKVHALGYLYHIYSYNQKKIEKSERNAELVGQAYEALEKVWAIDGENIDRLRLTVWKLLEMWDTRLRNDEDLIKAHKKELEELHAYPSGEDEVRCEVQAIRNRFTYLQELHGNLLNLILLVGKLKFGIDENELRESLIRGNKTLTDITRETQESDQQQKCEKPACRQGFDPQTKRAFMRGPRNLVNSETLRATKGHMPNLNVRRMPI